MEAGDLRQEFLREKGITIEEWWNATPEQIEKYVIWLEQKALCLGGVVKAKRTCAKCNSNDVIMFTADLDICNSCGCTQDGA